MCSSPPDARSVDALVRLQHAEATARRSASGGRGAGRQGEGARDGMREVMFVTARRSAIAGAFKLSPPAAGLLGRSPVRTRAAAAPPHSCVSFDSVLQDFENRNCEMN